MNYIKLLNAAFGKFFFDDRLNPTHISLYMALFLEWNSCRFADDFYINRRDLMVASKIGSKSTYHRCLRDLNSWDYLFYFPSKNPYKGSKIKMFNFETSYKQVMDSYNPINGQALVSNNKHIQTNKNINKLDQPKNENDVITFFKKEKWPIIEAQKFFNHYQGIGWKVGGKTKIVNWQATAKNWMLKAEEIKTKINQKAVSQNQDNLKTSKNKNYNEPL